MTNDKLSLNCNFDDAEAQFVFRFFCDDDQLIGLEAELEILMRGQTKRPDGYSDQSVVFSHDFFVQRGENELKFSPSELGALNYNGNEVELGAMARVSVDDGYIMDSSVECSLPLQSCGPPHGLGVSKNLRLIVGKDEYSFFANFLAVSLFSKLKLFLILAVFGVCALANLGLSIFDQFVADVPVLYTPELLGQKFLNEETPPLAYGFGGAFVGFLGLKLTLKRLLRSYLHIKPLKAQRLWRRDDRVRMSDLFSAFSRTSLENVTLRLVASQFECGAYERTRDDESETVRFRNLVASKLLAEKKISRIRRGLDIANFASVDVPLNDIFDNFLPSTSSGSYNALALEVRLYIITPDFADVSLSVDVAQLDRAGFSALY